MMRNVSLAAIVLSCLATPVIKTYPLLAHTTIKKYPLSSYIRKLEGQFISRYGLKILTGVLLIISISASTTAFFYPLEIETREATVWLHVLALKQGINIYDHSRVAFVNMNHGPLDPLFKFWIASVFPFLESWQVTRFAVFLLPYGFLFIAWRLVSKSSTQSRLHALLLGSVGYLFLMVTAKDWLFVGRSDATVALLLLLLIYISTSFCPKSEFMTALHGFISGAIGISLILTSWRTTPTAFAVWAFALWKFKYADGSTWRQTLIYLMSWVLAAVGVWGFLIYYLFNFDLALYYRHFFGFFSKSLGMSGFPYSDGSVTSLISFILSLFNPIGPRDTYKGGPLLLAFVVYFVATIKNEALSRGFVVLSGFVFISCAVAYFLNYWGGGTWYFIPFLITLWFYLCDRQTTIAQWRLTLVGICVLALIGVNLRMVVFPSLNRAMRMHEAYSFMTLVRSLQRTNTILSEDTFFFRTSYQDELIDMGDTATIAVKSGYFGDEFNKTVDRHFERIQNYPTDYIITGFTESPELRKLIEEKYVLRAEGPRNLTATYYNSSRLFMRRDLVTRRLEN
jgi:hypothetical protein